MMSKKRSGGIKMISLLLALVLSLCLTGCNGGGVTSSDVGTESTVSTTERETATTKKKTTTATTTKKKETTTKKKTTASKVATTTWKLTTTKYEPNKVWKQSQFHISTFTCGSSYEAVAAHREAGFTLLENAYKNYGEGLYVAQNCEQVGIHYLLQNSSSLKGYSGVGAEHPTFSEDIIKEVTEEMKGYQYFEGWYIWDEVPMQKFEECKKVRDWFGQYSKNKLAYCIMFPSYGNYPWNFSEESNWKESLFYKYVTSYVETIDPPILSFDYYPFQLHGGANADFTNCNWWRDMGLFRTLSMETGKPFWFYFQAYNMDQGYRFTNEMRSMQMYAAIAYGAKTVSYYNTKSQLVCVYGDEKAPEFNDIKTLNAKVKNLGDFLFKKNTEELFQFGIEDKNQVLYQLDRVEDSDLIAGAPDGTIVGVFGDGTSKKYVLVVNKSFKNDVKGTLNLKANKAVQRYDHIKNKTTTVANSTSTIDVKIPAGECALFVLK